jgi:hypothetical protein
MKDAKILLILALGISLAVSAPAACEPIPDPEPVNMAEASAFYDYRDYAICSRTDKGGAKARSGAYFDLNVGVILGEWLSNFEDVIKVKAEHLDTGQELFLIRDTCTIYIGREMQYWFLLLRPESWMFEGIWEFTMTYKDSEKKKHRQTKQWEMRPVAFPLKPSYIEITKGESDFLVSWSAIGMPSPASPFDYRVRIYQEGCCVAEVRGDWRGGVGWYDPAVNKVNFPIASGWSRAQLRLENRVLTGPPWPAYISRACQYLQLPE